MAVASELSKLPAEILSFLASSGLKIVAVPHSPVDYDSSLFSADVRGHSGANWSLEPGTFYNDTLIIATDGVNSQGSSNLTFHELGHAIDAILGRSIGPAFGYRQSLASGSVDFALAYGSIKQPFNAAVGAYYAYFSPTNNLNDNHAYLSETFAESFAEYYNSSPISGKPTWNQGYGHMLTPGRSSLSDYWRTFKWPSH